MMRNVRFVLPFIVMSLGWSAGAWAGILVQGAGSVISVDNSVNGVDSPDTRYVGNFAAGYAFPQEFLVAAQLLTFHSTSTAETVYTYGPKAGLLLKGFELSIAYFVDAQDNVSGLNRAGSGFAVNVGYTFHLSGPLRLGAMYTYWQANYNTQNGVALTNKYTQTYNIPQVELAIEF